MRIIIGLGNPGKRYAGTWHNLGFICVDSFAEKHGMNFRSGKGSFYAASGLLNSEKILVVKPATYMNLSGMAVAEVLNYYGASSEDALVVYDDINIPLGTMRIKGSGSAGGHNGIKSIINSIGTEHFKRLRIGFRTESTDRILERDPDILADLVLSKIPSSLSGEVVESVENCVDAIECFLNKGLDVAMNTFNRGVKEK